MGIIMNHTTSLEISKELKTIGFPQETEKIWVEEIAYPENICLMTVIEFEKFHSVEDRTAFNVYAAPLLTELMEKMKDAWEYIAHNMSYKDFLNDNACDNVGLLFIQLKKENII